MAVTEAEAELAMAEIQALVDFGTDFAKKMMLKHDPWIPFAFTKREHQTVTMCGFMPSESETRNTRDMIAFARRSLRDALEPTTKAVALVYEGLTRHPDGAIRDPDTIMVEVDHRVGGALLVATPFERTRNWYGKKSIRLSEDVSVLECAPIAFPDPIGEEP